MPGFRLKLNGLRNIAYASFTQESLPFDISFGTEYFFRGAWHPIVVRPMLVGTIVIFLVQFAGCDESMALVYNEKDTWSDIEKESTSLTEAVGAAIESYYSTSYSSWSDLTASGEHDGLLGDHHFN
jgi:hypothetical protein